MQGERSNSRSFIVDTSSENEGEVFLKIEVMSESVQVLPVSFTVGETTLTSKPNSPPIILDLPVTWNIEIQLGTSEEILLQCPQAIDVDSDSIEIVVDVSLINTACGDSFATAIIQTQSEMEREFSILLDPGKLVTKTELSNEIFTFPVSLSDG